MKKYFASIPRIAISISALLPHSARSGSIIGPSADTYITGSSALGGSGSVHGTETGLYSDRTKLAFPLIRFDLSSFAGLTITGSPQFLLLVGDGTRNGTTRQVSIYDVAVPWTEATTFDSFGPSPGLQIGQDTSASALATVPVVFPQSQVLYTSWMLPASLVQRWIDNPSSNNGLLVYNNETTTGSDLSFVAIESHGNVARLFVDAVPEPSTFLLGVIGIFAIWRHRSKNERNG